MANRFDAVLRKADEWSLRADLPESQRNAAKTLHVMANRVGRNAASDPAARKSVRIVSCYLCRRTGSATCGVWVLDGDRCPLGFDGDGAGAGSPTCISTTT